MKETKLRLEEQQGGIPIRVIIDEEQAQNEKTTLDKMVCEEKMKLMRERAVRIAREYLYGPLDERLEEAYRELIKIAKGMNQSKIKAYIQTIHEAYRQASEKNPAPAKTAEEVKNSLKNLNELMNRKMFSIETLSTLGAHLDENLTTKRARLAMELDDLFHAGGNGESVIQALDDYLDARGK